METHDRHKKESAQSDVSRAIRSSAIGLAGFAVLYCICFGLYLRFPYLRPGDNLVAEMKHDTARDGNLFRTQRGEKLHVMAFGYSKMLAGFKPAIFDEAMAKAGFLNVESYDFGLPGDSRFVGDLEAMAAHGTPPDIALLTFPWPPAPEPGPTFFHFINNDQDLMNEIFPFRHILRNLFILAAEARGVSRIGQIYEEDKRAVFQVSEDRGYYFIARQSHYPNDELPRDLRLPTDTPSKLSPRVITLGPIYQHLAGVLAANKIKCIFIPSYFREGEFAQPPPLNANSVKVLANQPNVSIEGPDYWLYPNRYFSDPVHGNRPGAELYTKEIAGLVTQWLQQQKAAQP